MILVMRQLGTKYLALITHACNVFVDVQIEVRNNKLEMQSVNNKSLIEELDKLLERLCIPSEVPFITLIF